ncbi:hypothetical protein FHS23_003516 [Prauserella isguenensis]|uniref:Uncharacterized protein n=1 Tax=Prauserella isguenensis TaxID=1470180 RepID=A0A839S519_9PSEU|nr:hypothetical protein [Prauserella isguenensis]
MNDHREACGASFAKADRVRVSRRTRQEVAA